MSDKTTRYSRSLTCIMCVQYSIKCNFIKTYFCVFYRVLFVYSVQYRTYVYTYSTQYTVPTVKNTHEVTGYTVLSKVWVESYVLISC